MIRVRAALYLDFDNVFSGLLKLDPDVAIQFAENPGSWLTRLSTSLTVDGPRRWLVLRCYMNPAGWVPHPDPEAGVARLYFSRFRPFFTSAGFEVIDCPRLTHTKNAADIRLVVDAVDALSAEPAYDEFVIASGDSDMTPLLVRLRAGDRRTTIVSPSDAADAFTAVADRLVDGQQVLELVQGEQIDPDDEAEVANFAELPGIPDRNVPMSGDERPDRDEAFERFRTIVTERYVAASGPLNLRRWPTSSVVSSAGRLTTVTGLASVASPGPWRASSSPICGCRSICCGTAAATRPLTSPRRWPRPCTVLRSLSP